MNGETTSRWLFYAGAFYVFFLLSHAWPNPARFLDKVIPRLGSVHHGGAQWQAVTPSNDLLHIDLKNTAPLVGGNARMRSGRFDLASQSKVSADRAPVVDYNILSSLGRELLPILPQLVAAFGASTPALATVIASRPVAGIAAPADETLLLDVQVNGHSIGKIGEFTLRRGKLMAQLQELRDLGFLVPASVAGHGGLIALSDMPWISWRFDQNKQELYVTVSNANLLPTVLRFNGTEILGSRRKIESGTGMTLNYDTAYTFASGQNGTSGSLDMRAFSPWGIVSSGWLGYAGASMNGSGTNTAVRLDSAYTFADVNTLRRYSLGDFITGGLSWTRPIHLGGAQIRSDFSMRPDLVTFPMPMVAGSAAVPSTVDVLTNGNLMISSQVAAGPFEVPQLPVMSGAGTISMTVTNALGQQVQVTQPFYASSTLLSPGLQTFAGQAGVVRRNWGTISNDYGKIAGTAIYRRGLTRKFTLEGSIEGTPGAFAAGAGGVAQIGNLGVINFSAAAGAGSGHSGAQLAAGAQHIGRVFSMGASALMATQNYLDVAAMNGGGVPRKQISAFASLYLRRFGTLGGAYAGLDQDASPNTGLLGVASAENSRVVSANYSLQFHRVSFYASEYTTIASTGNRNGLQFGMTIPIGKQSSVSISGTSDGSGQVQAQKSASQIGDWGYQAYVATDDANHEFGQVQYKSPVSMFTAGVDSDAGQTTLRIQSQGALSLVDKTLFPSNQIFDSFAIVDTAPMPHIHVMQENRDVGRTSSSGRLLVPDMRSFDRNSLSIVPTDVPPDATINDVSREVRPQDRSGVVVRFPIQFSHGALLKLVDEAGVALPLGSTARLGTAAATVPIGYDGDVYVEGLGPHNEITVERPDGGHCTVAFVYRPVPGDIPSIGPLRCMEPRL